MTPETWTLGADGYHVTDEHNPREVVEPPDPRAKPKPAPKRKPRKPKVEKSP